MIKVKMKKKEKVKMSMMTWHNLDMKNIKAEYIASTNKKSIEDNTVY